MRKVSLLLGMLCLTVAAIEFGRTALADEPPEKKTKTFDIAASIS